MADQPKRRKRRWLSFSLRTFLVAVFLIAVPMGVVGHRWHRYQQQEEAIEELDASSCRIEFHQESLPTRWKCLLTGEQLAGSVRRIDSNAFCSNFGHYPFVAREIDLHSLRMFGRLEYVSLYNYDEPDLRPLAGLPQLRELEISAPNAESITGLHKLWRLERLNHSVIDIAPLAELTQLKVLSLNGVPISDITPLAELTQLQELDLTATDVADLTPLARLTQLRYLNLSATKVTDLTPLAKSQRKGTFYFIDEALQARSSDLHEIHRSASPGSQKTVR